MGDPNPPLRPLKEYFTPNAYESPSCIRLPNVTADHFEIKSSTLQMLPIFYGRPNEDPYSHLDEFLEKCSTFKLQNFTDEALRLRLFPFSLKDKAKHWLVSLPADTITTWAQMQQAFLNKYFPMGRTNQIRKSITTFTALPSDQFHESWERFKELLRSCPHHAVPKWQLAEYFYAGMSENTRQMIDGACAGTFMSKNEDEAWEIFENLSENSSIHASSYRSEGLSPTIAQKRAGIIESSSTNDVNAKVDDLAKKFDKFLLSVNAVNPQVQSSSEVCSLCCSPAHPVSECPLAPQYPEFVEEQVNAMQASYPRPGNNPYAPTYNPG